MAHLDLKFAVEEFTAELYHEVYPLLVGHWEEIANEKDKISLNLNLEAYLKMNELGFLHCISCRQDGKLVGYLVSVLTRNLHHSQIAAAANDVIYIHPNHRKGMLAVRLLKFFEKCMREKNVTVAQMHVTPSRNFGPILERMGYYQSEIIYRKYIGD